jgi:hypothetical protein
MTNKLVVVINTHKETKIEKILLLELKFLVPNNNCIQNPLLRGYRPQIAFCLASTEFVEPPPKPNNISGYATGVEAAQHRILSSDPSLFSLHLRISLPYLSHPSS